jgi:methylated-DNA-[protein]-cysteine S-methyltransferase
METNTRHATVTTPLGTVTLVAAGDALTGLYFSKHWYRPDANCFGTNVPVSSDKLLSEAQRQLDDYLNGTRTSFDVPVETNGDAFQERIWSLIKEIPYGETTTYGELAQKYGDRSLARDVGQAVGRNPLAIIVPCHRVVGKGGNLVGYAGGLERKKALLEIEGQALHPGNKLSGVRNLTLQGVLPFAQSGK